MSAKDFDAVMAEDWRPSGAGLEVVVRDGPNKSRREWVTMEAHFDGAPALRSSVAVLGKRALALVIANEWAGERELATSLCVECCARESEGHSPGCEWGAVVAAAKALQGGR
jgi:hypothetical protein